MRLPRPPFLLLLLLALGIAFAADALGRMQPVRKVRAGLPPFSVLETLARHNDRLVAEAVASAEDRAGAVTPHLTWLADCDARVQATLLLPDPVARIHAVRNMGNQLMLSAAAVDYGVNELHTPVLLITGNTDSDAIRLFRKGYDHLGLEMRRTLDHLHLPLKGLNGGENDALLVERNVDFQVAEAGRRYEERVRSGRLVVAGAVFDLDNQYGKGKNRLVLININGETDPARLRAMPHLTRLDRRLLELVGRPRRPQAAAEPKIETP